jgi:predicted alpha/beta-hydrolase family hydrolase
MTTLRKLLLAAAAFSTLAFAAPASAGAFDHFYATIREAARGLPNHTVFRPADMTVFGPNALPIVLYANGGCNASNFGATYILTVLAARGFFVVANGAFDAVLAGGTTTPSKVTDAINWIDQADAQFFNRLDTTRVAVMGQSCGGLEALVAGANPRVSTVVALNTGFFPTPSNGFGREQLANLHKPVLVFNGGPQDIAYQNSIDNYNLLVAQGTNAYLASNSHAWHSGLLFGIRDGIGDTGMLAQAEKLIVNWLDYWLVGNTAAGRYFFGFNCGLCVQPDWSVKTNMDRPDVLALP